MDAKKKSDQTSVWVYKFSCQNTFGSYETVLFTNCNLVFFLKLIE